MSVFGDIIDDQKARIAALKAELAVLRERLAKYEREDDAELVTLDWFRETISTATTNHLDLDKSHEWFLFYMADGAVTLCCERHDNLPSLSASCVSQFGRVFTTRGQVRRLIAALRVEP